MGTVTGLVAVETENGVLTEQSPAVLVTFSSQNDGNSIL